MTTPTPALVAALLDASQNLALAARILHEEALRLDATFSVTISMSSPSRRDAERDAWWRMFQAHAAHELPVVKGALAQIEELVGNGKAHSEEVNPSSKGGEPIDH